MNIYKKVLEENLEKLLALYNFDIVSSTYGLGDRDYWGWKTKDFSNATMQGGIHSLAIAIELNLFNDEYKKSVINIIDAAIRVIPKIKAENGSLSEAYPQENSFCVTALVAFDALSAIKHIKGYLSDSCIKSYFEILSPLIQFVSKNDETHAFISNHLATAVAAIFLWNELTGEENYRGDELLKLIIDNQSHEGWYLEYEGPDPGYQTLCTYYLSIVYQISPSECLFQSLQKSARFLSYFIHPDGTIGGLYGSRNTEVYYPGGIIALSNEIEEFALLAQQLTPQKQHVLPQVIDAGNFVPLVNSYAYAALSYMKNSMCIHQNKLQPFHRKNDFIHFSNAGIIIVANSSYFLILNYKKGGVVKIFDNKEKKFHSEDGGLFGYLSNGKKFSTQQYDENITYNDGRITARFYLIDESTPTSAHLILLRFFSLTIFKSVFLGNLFKQYIVKRLMTGKKKIDGEVIREFIFLDKKVLIKEFIKVPNNSLSVKHYGKVKAIHMASSGYFLPQQVYQKSKTPLLEFVSG